MIVTPGLTRGPMLRFSLRQSPMDCRIKSGNDD
jgi:hypothetical protein